MTQDQVMGLLRQLIPTTGMFLTSVGLVTTAQADLLVSSSLTILGPLMIIGSIGWSIVANSKVSILKSAARMPEVNEIKISTPKGAEPGTASDLAKSVDAPEITVTTRGI